jgi:UDP-glucose 4-epimerase
MTNARTPAAFLIGGAGYVGGAAAWAFHRAGYRVDVYDDLGKGSAEGLPAGVRLHRGCGTDVSGLGERLLQARPDVVLHFAGSIEAGESMRDPLKYLEGNVRILASTLRAMERAGLRRILFASSAGVYAPSSSPLREVDPLVPGNPYGESKLACERLLQWAAPPLRLEALSLRFFNAAGACEGRPERHRPETHLIPRILDAARGSAPAVQVFGDDYPTPDGTCVRDYVHVADLAEAHLRAVDLFAPGHRAFNIGSGRGHSVLEVVRAAEQITGRRIRIDRCARREGDPPCLVADPGAFRAATGWNPRRSSLERILKDAWTPSP